MLLANPDRLFDRTWRPRHPLRPRLSHARRVAMLILLVVLSAVIFGYCWITDPNRVRAMAESYLANLMGGEVRIGRANLSIFEGLRLDDVTLLADVKDQPDSRVFHARTLMLHYRPKNLLKGEIVATQIVAIDPVAMLVENPTTGQWNYQRLRGIAAMERHSDKQSLTPTVLPQIILRDAQVAYLELRGGRTVPVGWYSLEGSLTPSEDPDRYDFSLQSRGRESLGPSVDGSLRTDGGQCVAHLKNFVYGPDVQSMLLAEPRAWCQWHQLQGHLDVPEMSYTPGRNGAKPSFMAELVLSGVELAVHPQEWMSRQQNQNLQWFHDELDIAQQRHWISGDTADSLRQLSTPEPLHLQQVSGVLKFTDRGITMEGISGKLEENWFNVDGTIDGYSPGAPASVTLQSQPGNDLEISAGSPPFVGSLPAEVQDIYEQIHPQGICALWLKLQRKQEGAAPSINGRIDIHDGRFSFDDFPYPLSHATGRIMVGHDPIAGMDGIRVLNLQAHGPDGGPNAHSTVYMDGFVGPLQGVSGIWLDIRGLNFHDEPALVAALPASARSALALLDPSGHGEYPKFSGDFLCHIVRPIGAHKLSIATDINLTDAQGQLSAFPYPLRGVTGRLEVRDGYLNLVRVRMRHGDGTVRVDGAITWRLHDAPQSAGPFGPTLKIVAKNLPLDDDLKSALPAEQRSWLEKLGAAGKLDVEGQILPADKTADKPHAGDIDYNVDAVLRDGALRPGGGQVLASDVSGHIHLTPGQLSLSNAVGHRGDSTLKASLDADWSTPQKKISLTASADNLMLDNALYQALPKPLQADWDVVHPQGTVDASVDYGAGGVQVKIHPRQLSVTPAPVPYRLDNVQGLLTATDSKVVLDNIRATHGKAAISLSGHGDLGEHPVWELRLSADQLPVDDELVQAAPDAAADLCKALKLSGTIGLEISRLAYRPGGADGKDDADFATKLTLQGASMEVGLSARDMVGSVDLAGLVRGGKLSRMAGRCAVDTLSLAGRQAANLRFDLAKASDDQTVQVSHLEGVFAGGDIAGDGQFSFPDSGPGQYDVSLILRDADIQELTPIEGKKIDGRLTASLQMSGNWDQPSSRRGHGNVSIIGQNLYNIPLMMGLLQISDLTLPLTSPFSDATARYNIDGQKVSFEQINLRSKDMSMSGSGDLDFAAGKVSLWFVTDNPTLLSLPLVGPLIQGAKQELLKIHVSGTIEKPKVSARSFDTITTTVDQVFKNDQQK
jgi:hypothetical protein